MKFRETNRNKLCLIREDDLLDLVSSAYTNGHNDTVESNYCDPREVVDHMLNLIEDCEHDGHLEVTSF